MAVDPILGLNTLTEGDSLGYLRQNDYNLINSFFAVKPEIIDDSLLDSVAAGVVVRGAAYILSGVGTTLWAGYNAGDIAIALSATPASASGWFFLTPSRGTRVWITGGSALGHAVWNGTAWVAV